MRIVLHIDMDAFFASVEERDKPRLKGLPIVVGADPAGGRGRGVVSTANYAARKYGIKSALPISRAWDLSQQAKKAGKPEAVFLEPNIRRYSEVSRAIFSYVATQGSAFEQTSIDEGYLELKLPITNYQLPNQAWEEAVKVANSIKRWVQDNQKLTCSIGIGPNKLISKIAAGRQKPDGLTIIKDKEVQDFLDPLSVRELPGIGPKTEQKLNSYAIATVKQLRGKSKEFLVENFGKHGEGMYRQARGIDDSPIETEYEQKSIGEQLTFDKDTLDAPTILKAFKKMAESVGESLKREKKKFKTVAIIVRFSDFQTFTRSHTIATATHDKNILETEALKLLLPFLDSRENPKRKLIRLVGVRAENLEE